MILVSGNGLAEGSFREIYMIISEPPRFIMMNKRGNLCMNCFEIIMVYIQGEDDNVANYYCYFKYKNLFRRILIHTHKFWGTYFV